MKKSQLVIYQTKSGAIELRGDYQKETMWATQAQIIDIFEIDQSVVSRHINNVFQDGEISRKSNMQKMHIANSDKPITLYSLDVILAVGYRANSSRAIRFRQWATKTLRQHLIEGYTINRSRISKNYDNFMKAVSDVKALLPASSTVDTGSILELITVFADTWVSLDAYDREKYPSKGVTKKRVQLTAQQLGESLQTLKKELIRKGEATDLFASSRSSSAVESIVGNVMQTFGGKDLYPSIEEKAAHLLYFMVKNHPFVDGNKRSGAFSFVWLLQKAKLLNPAQLSPTALTALTLLIAESNPKDKERLTGLVILMLKR
jgi:prophage maintenance system killer protein